MILNFINRKSILFAPILYPASILYLLITKIRNILYDRKILQSYKSTLDVLCVGNLTVGGNGKTPVVAALHKHYSELGRKVVIVSRGYKSSGKTGLIPEITDANLDTLIYSFGDEPVLHKYINNAAVYVDSDRVRAIKNLEKLNNFDLVILDDGFQHRRLTPSTSIILQDISTDRLLNEWNINNLLPYGDFRECIKDSLNRISKLVFVYRSALKVNLEEDRKNIAVKALGESKIGARFLNIYSDSFINLNNLQEVDKPTAAIAITAIAKPKIFFSNLQDLGIKLIDQIEYQDHHNFTVEDILKIDFENYPLITTFKDAIKLIKFVTNKDLLNSYPKLRSLRVIILKQRLDISEIV